MKRKIFVSTRVLAALSFIVMGLFMYGKTLEI